MKKEKSMPHHPSSPPAEKFEVKELQVASVYLKDLSFEVPYAPKIFLDHALTSENGAPGKPTAETNVEVECKLLPNELAEVIFCLKTTVKLGPTIAFIAEIQQAALLLIKSNLDEERKKIYLKEVGARILTPYVRESLSNLSVRANFPPLFLEANEFLTAIPENNETIPLSPQVESEDTRLTP